jgi:hypothetical protein
MLYRRVGEEHNPMQTITKKDYNSKRQAGMYTGGNKRGRHPGEL